MLFSKEEKRESTTRSKKKKLCVSSHQKREKERHSSPFQAFSPLSLSPSFAMPRQGRRGSADHAGGGSTPIATAASRDRSKTRAGAAAAALGDDDDDADDVGFADRATRRAEVLAAQYGSPAPRRSQGSYAAGKRGRTWAVARRNWGPSCKRERKRERGRIADADRH